MDERGMVGRKTFRGRRRCVEEGRLAVESGRQEYGLGLPISWEGERRHGAKG